MSLLEDLRDDNRGSSGGDISRQASGMLDLDRKALRRQDLSYFQAVTSSSSGDRKVKANPTIINDTAASRGKELGHNEWILVQHRKRKSTSPRKDIGKGKSLAGRKRPWSPDKGLERCSRCFRSSHTMAECHHQVVCRRFECAGHVAVNCPLVARGSPRRKKIRVGPRPTSEDEKVEIDLRLKPQGSTSNSTGRSLLTYVKLSIPIPLEVSSICDDLETVGILSLRMG